MSFAYMPLYTGDYLRDTRHLTPTKHGVYLLLLMHCFDQKGPLPLDEQECAGIANCRSADEVDSLRYILDRYFVRMDDGWYNRRMQTVIEKAESISHYRSEAGRKGYQARVKQLPSKSQALASNPNPNPILSPTPTSKETSTTKSGKPDILAREVLNFLNNATDRKYRPVPSNLKPIAARIAETSVEHCKAVICDRTAKWKNDTKMDEYLRPATLFGAQKFHQYLPDAEKAFFDQPEEP